MAFPVGYTLYRGPRLTATAEGGPAIQVTEFGQTYIPSQFISQLSFAESRSKHFAWVVGSVLNMPLSNRLSVVVPVELVRTGSSLIVTSRLTVGAGLRIGVHRGVVTAQP